MRLRRLVPLLTLLALLFAPLGRTAAAEAAMPAHAASAMAAHCSDMAAPAQDDQERSVIDCMIACAALAPPVSSPLDEIAAELMRGEGTAPATFPGISLQFDPPPPRRS